MPIAGCEPTSATQRCCLTAIIAAGVFLLALGSARTSSAHAELVRASPALDGLLVGPTQRIDLWFSEAVGVGAGSPTVRVLDEAGRDLPRGNVAVDPEDPTHVSADVSGVGLGTFTVSWSERSADDGHSLAGTYGFRVGSGGPVGGATVQGEAPRAWAVASRWLTFLGIALAAGGFFFTRVVLGDLPDRAGRRFVAIASGSAVALLASLLEPVLQTRWPPAGMLTPTLREAIAGLPAAWWLRPGVLPLLFLLTLALLVRQRRGRSPGVVAEWVGLTLALAALLGLSLTSHAAARDTWRWLSVSSDALHQWTVALWIGGLAHLALWWPSRQAIETAELTTSECSDPLRRFSRLALGLVLVAVATGVTNAGLALPALRTLWSSRYGDLLLLKVALLMPPLVLATFHRRALRRAFDRFSMRLRTTVRLEFVLVLAVVLAGTLLALLAPPVVRATQPLDLAAATDDATLLVRLQVQPAKPGANALRVVVNNRDGNPVASDQIALVRLTFTSLNQLIEPTVVEARHDLRDGYAVSGIQLSLKGWWGVRVLVRRLGQVDTEASFYLSLPDPNVNGWSAGPPSDGSDMAKAVFTRGLAGLTSLHRVRFQQRLSDGAGTLVEADLAVSDGGDGRPAASSIASRSTALLRIGDSEWLRLPNGQWTEQHTDIPVAVPATWGEDYAGATDFRLGRTEEIDGETTQIVSFLVPGRDRRAPARYAWWVGVDSGRVRRWAMIARAHYMIKDYRGFDAPLLIEPPVAGVGTPVASPSA